MENGKKGIGSITLEIGSGMTWDKTPLQHVLVGCLARRAIAAAGPGRGASDLVMGTCYLF